MINSLKDWVINICSAVIFIAAVEMILPDNSMKKYGKFVLGLILILVLLDPILRIFNQGAVFDNEMNKSIDFFKTTGTIDKVAKAEETNIENTKIIFKKNLEKKSEEILIGKYPKDNFNTNVEVSYDAKEKNFIIKSAQVYLGDSSVEKVKRVEINSKNDGGENKVNLNDEKAKAIKEVLSTELKISKDVISVFKQ